MVRSGNVSADSGVMEGADSDTSKQVASRYIVFGQSLQRTEVAITAHAELQDRLSVGVVFANRRIFGVGRELAADGADASFDVDRAVLGGFVGEEDDDAGHTLDRAGLDVVDVVDAGDGVLDLFGDQRVDRLRAGARVDRRDHHDRKVKRRKQVHAQPGPRDQADDQQRADRHEHEQRPLDGDSCELHVWLSLLGRAP